MPKDMKTMLPIVMLLIIVVLMVVLKSVRATILQCLVVIISTIGRLRIWLA